MCVFSYRNGRGVSSWLEGRGAPGLSLGHISTGGVGPLVPEVVVGSEGSPGLVRPRVSFGECAMPRVVVGMLEVVGCAAPGGVGGHDSTGASSSSLRQLAMLLASVYDGKVPTSTPACGHPLRRSMRTRRARSLR